MGAKDALAAMGPRQVKSIAADASRVRHPSTKFFWFKYACGCSWMIILLNFLMFCTAWAALAKVMKIEEEICVQPEVLAASNNATDCRPWFKPFSNCLDGGDLVGSVLMRQCLLGDTDNNNGPLIDNAAAYASATLAYGLAQRYEGGTVDVDLARSLMRQEMDQFDRRRLEVAAPRTLDESAATARAWRAGARLAADALLGRRRASDADADAAPRRELAGNGTALSPDAALAEAYDTLSVATALALIANKVVGAVYGYLMALGVLVSLPALLALRSLGNWWPHCCSIPTRVETMRKVSMRLACHTAWCSGVVVLLTCALIVAKFQILMRYLDRPGFAVPSRWGVYGITSVAVPCIFGIVAGLLPTFFAMILSRARAERRDSMAEDIHLKRYHGKAKKPLTAPTAVLQGPPPNPAMLNPDMDEERLAKASVPMPGMQRAGYTHPVQVDSV